MTPCFFKSFILVNIFIILTNLFETFIRFFQKTLTITVATVNTVGLYKQLMLLLLHLAFSGVCRGLVIGLVSMGKRVYK